MQAWEASAGVGPRELAVLAATAFLAMALAGFAQGSIDPSAGSSSLLVGELKLADDDEGPADRVHATFQAEDLLPGERTEDRLTLIREPPPRPRPGAVQARLSLDVNGAEGPLADNLTVERLAYGGESLREAAAQACGTPLSLSGLADCTGERRGPLQGLADPTPEGRDLVLGVRLPVSAGNEIQGASTEFTVEAHLAAWPVSQAPDLPASSGSSPPSQASQPSSPSGASDIPVASPVVSVPVEACGALVPDTSPIEARAHVQVPGVLVQGSVPVDTLLETHLAAGCGTG